MGVGMSRTPRDLVDYGCYWIRDHRRAFRTLMRIVHAEAERGNPCVQRGDMYMLARQRGIDVGDVREFRRDNSLWSVIARYMVMLRPKLARSLNFKKCDIDGVDMAARFRAIVDPGALFLAETWMEAKEAVASDDASAQIGGGRWQAKAGE